VEKWASLGLVRVAVVTVKKKKKTRFKTKGGASLPREGRGSQKESTEDRVAWQFTCFRGFILPDRRKAKKRGRNEEDFLIAVMNERKNAN